MGIEGKRARPVGDKARFPSTPSLLPWPYSPESLSSEVRVGVEPTNSGFADRRLGPLGYRTKRWIKLGQYRTRTCDPHDVNVVL